jgi:hypothetical protein
VSGQPKRHRRRNIRVGISRSENPREYNRIYMAVFRAIVPSYYKRELRQQRGGRRPQPRGPRDPRLPATYPGCWQAAAFRKKYGRAQMQIARERGAETRKPRNVRLPKTFPGCWKNQPFVRKYMRIQSSIARAVKRRGGDRCFYCGRQAKNVKRIERMIPDKAGELVTREVLYCGVC